MTYLCTKSASEFRFWCLMSNLDNANGSDIKSMTFYYSLSLS